MFDDESLLDKFSRKTGVVVTPSRIPHAKTANEVTLPGFKSWAQTNTYDCGFAAALMVVRYFDKRASLAKLYTLVGSSPVEGVSTTKLVKALRHYHVRVTHRDDLTFEAIMAAIDRGCPIITFVKSGDADADHAVCLYGYGLEPDRVFVAGYDILHNRPLEWHTFERRWDVVGAGLVCSKP